MSFSSLIYTPVSSRSYFEISQFIAALIILILIVGPVGYLVKQGYYLPDLITLTIWYNLRKHGTVSALGRRSIWNSAPEISVISWPILLGGGLDILVGRYIGFWLIGLTAVTILAHYFQYWLINAEDNLANILIFLLIVIGTSLLSILAYGLPELSQFIGSLFITFLAVGVIVWLKFNRRGS